MIENLPIIVHEMFEMSQLTQRLRVAFMLKEAGPAQWLGIQQSRSVVRLVTLSGDRNTNPAQRHDTWQSLWWLRRGADTHVIVRRYGGIHEIGAIWCLNISRSRNKRRKGYAILKLNET